MTERERIWWSHERKNGSFFFISDWVRHHFNEEFNFKEMDCCVTCSTQAVKMRCAGRSWNDVFNFIVVEEHRVFPINADPSVEELDAACRVVWKPECSEMIKQAPSDAIEILLGCGLN